MRLSASFMAVVCSEQGRGGPSFISYAPPPPPLLLGILATETQKRMKEEEEEELRKRGTTGTGESCGDRCCRVEQSSGDKLKAGPPPPDVAGRPRGQECRRYGLGGGVAATAK